MADIEHNALIDSQLHVVGFVQASDPGAVGEGIVWVDTSGGAGLWEMKIRDSANTGWEVGYGGAGYMTDWEDDTSATAGGDVDMSDKDLHNIKQVDFQDTHDNGTSGAGKAIDWNEGNTQKVQLTANCTFTFTAPAGPCGLTLYLIGNATAYTTTFPATAEFVDDGATQLRILQHFQLLLNL